MAEAIVTLPDGRKARVKGQSKAEVEAVIRQMLAEQQPLQGRPTLDEYAAANQRPAVSQGLLSTDAVAQGGAEGLVQNFLLGPAEFLMRGARGGSNVLRAATGNDMVPVPQEGLLGTNPREAISGLESLLTRIPSEQIQQRRNQTQVENPMSYGLGETGADIFTVMAGRAPLLKGKKDGDILAPELKEIFSKAFPDAGADWLSKLAGRGLEGAVEGAALAIMKGGEPLETAALAGGSQIAGVLGLTVADKSGIKDLLALRPKEAGLKMAITAASMATLIQVFKESTPMGTDNWTELMESGKSAIEKLPLTLAIGFLGGLTGAGRVSTEFETLNKLTKADLKMATAVADMISTIPRTVVVDLIRETQEGDISGIETAFIKLAQHPEAFDQSDIRYINNGLKDGTFITRIKDKMSDEDFMTILSAPDGLESVPIKK